MNSNGTQWQDWFDHSNPVAESAVAKFVDALGHKYPEWEAILHNTAIVHDLGKLKDNLQKWYRTFYEKAFKQKLPNDARIGHTFFQKWSKHHQWAETITNQICGKRPGHQQEGVALTYEQSPASALLIAGHHGGLPNLHKSKNPKDKTIRSLFLSSNDYDTFNDKELNDLAQKHFEAAKKVATKLLRKIKKEYQCDLRRTKEISTTVDSEFLVRLLFSCLVDADWEDTERWMKKQSGDDIKLDIPPLSSVYDKISNIEAYRAEMRKEHKNQTICKLRDFVYDKAVAAAGQPQQFFTLNAPPGLAKTIAGLAFAIKHAKKHKLRRIIYVVHYLNVIEQNAEVIRQALGLAHGDLTIYEHHSIADPINDQDPLGTSVGSLNIRRANIIRSRINNWQCAIIVTTNTQFFDTLFSNMTGRCRKLHNIARSVVILDECQTLHAHYLDPHLEMIRQWIKIGGTTFLSLSATQPQWHIQHKSAKPRLKSYQIIKRPQDLFSKARRMTISWPSRQRNHWKYSELSDRALKRKQSLIIVDTRNKAKELFNHLSAQREDSDNIFHYSTSMCIANRNICAQNMLKCLKQKVRCHVASTQALEQGIDISFPFVYREIGPYQLIVQAGGRGNRHMALKTGKIFVFFLYDENGNLLSKDYYAPPDEWYRKGRDVLRQMIGGKHKLDINRPSDLQLYYRKLYQSGNLDAHDICKKRKQWYFYSVAEVYRTIADQSRPVLCLTWNEVYGNIKTEALTNWFKHARGIEKEPKDDEPVGSFLQRLLTEMAYYPYDRWLNNLINYFSANIFWNDFQDQQMMGTIVTDPDTAVDIWNGPYDDNLGLIY